MTKLSSLQSYQKGISARSYIMSYTISFILGLSLSILVARNLGPEDYGIYSMFTLVGQFGVTCVNCGFYSSSVTLIGSEHTYAKRLVAIKVRLIASLAMTYSIILLSLPIVLAVYNRFLMFYACGVLYIWLNAIQPLWVYQLSGMHSRFNRVLLMQRISLLILTSLALSSNNGVAYMIIALTLSPLGSIGPFLRDNGKLINCLNPSHFLGKRFRRVSILVFRREGKFLLVDLFSSIPTYVQTLLLMTFGSMVTFGEYSFIDKIRTYAVSVISPFVSMGYQVLCKHVREGMVAQAKRDIWRFILFSVAISGLISMMIVSMIPKLGSFSNGLYLHTYTPLLIMALFLPILTISSYIYLFIYTAWRLSRPVLVSQFLKPCIIIIVFLVLTKVETVVVSITLAMITSEILTFSVVSCIFPLKLRERQHS